MLSIGRLGVTGGADYYLERVANNVDDYYLGRGEAPGRWVGATAVALGLTGEVDAKAISNLLAGRSATGEDLGLQIREGRRPGYDLTFSAPKGISLLWAFGRKDVRDAIVAAHDTAVSSVLDHLSAEACYVRRGRDGTRLVEASGFIGAAFRHRTSRAGDPQLHSHVLVPNLVQGGDGRWSAPDGRHLYTWQKAAGTLYQSALRAELGPLGLAWQVRRNGLGELVDIPKTVLRAFSKRRADIEASLDQRGLASSRAAEVATLATRQGKPRREVGFDQTQLDQAHVDLRREAWAEELGAIELSDGNGGPRPATVDDVTGALDRESAFPADPRTTEATMRALAGEGGVSLDAWELDEQLAPDARVTPLTLLGSTFSRREAITAVARAFDVTPAEALRLTGALLDRESVVRVVANPDRGMDSGMDKVRTKAGRVVAATSGDRRYTTTELLAAEQRITEAAVSRIGDGSGQVGSEAIENVLAFYSHLDTEQTDGVCRLLSSGNGYDVVIGQAGTGKSTMLRAARVGWEGAGYRVIGTAVAARTAADLESGTGIPSSSLTQLLSDLKDGGGLTRGHVVVVEEASMIGSRSLDRLRAAVDTAQAKLVLVGDNRQLSSIDAGGALRSLANHLGPEVVTLTTNRRQSGMDQEWERQALSELRKGQVVPAVHAYAEHGRVTIVDTIGDARAALIDDWWKVHEEATTAILAIRRVDVAALNDMARARRQAAGELGEEVCLPSGKTLSVGDRVLLGKNQSVPEPVQANDPGRGRKGGKVRLRNGTFATVVGVAEQASRRGSARSLASEGHIHPARGNTDAKETRAPGKDRLAPVVVIELDDGRQAALPLGYTESSVSLGYALTVFRSQGITVDHTFGLGTDTLYQEAGYTQLSRGKLTNNLYVTAPENPRWEIGHGSDGTAQSNALASLVDALSESREQTMAADRLFAPPILSADELAVTYERHTHLGRWLTDHAPPDVSDQLARALERTEQASAGSDGVEIRTGARSQREKATDPEMDVEPEIIDTFERDTDCRDVGESRVEENPVEENRVGEAGDGSPDLAVLAEAQRFRNRWVGEHREEIGAWSDLDGAVHRYEYRLGQAAAYSRPDHLTALLGPLPERITDVERWQAAAGAMEAYRLRFSVTSLDVAGREPSGSEPPNPDQRAHWQRVVSVLTATGFSDPAATPATEPDRTWLSSLWDRISAIGRPRLEVPNREASGAVPVAGFDRDLDTDYELDQGLGDGFGL